MKKVTLVVSLLILLALIPASVFAAVPTFYCTYNTAGPGDGSSDDPWRCKTADELALAVEMTCKLGYPYAILYQDVSNGYYRHVVETRENEACRVTSSVFYPGTPPDTGVALPAPLLVSGALALGLALLAGGYFVYRKRFA